MKTALLSLIGSCAIALSVNAQTQPPASAPAHTPTATSTNKCETKETVSPIKPMKICVIGKTADLDRHTDRVAEAISPCNHQVETVLSEKAAEFRKDFTKTKDAGYTHFLIVDVTYSTGRIPYVDNGKAFKATLNLRLYEVASDKVVKRWEVQGANPVLGNPPDTDPDERYEAFKLAAEKCTNILEQLSSKKDVTDKKEKREEKEQTAK